LKHSSPTERLSSPTERLFYGWYILVGCFFLLFFQAGARHSFGVMFKPMIAQFGWNRASISLAFFVNTTIFALMLTIAGRFYDRYGPKWIIFISTVFMAAGYICISLIDRYGPKWIIFISTVFMAAGYICISLIDSLWEFYVYYGIVTAIGVGGASVPFVAALMSKWFEKRRGLAISLALIGNCVGQFALVPLFTAFVLHYNWRVSYFLIGLIILVVNTILAFTVIKGDPQDLGVTPSGRQEQTEITDEPEQTSARGQPADLGLKDAMRTYSLWLFLIAMFICGSGDFLITAHLIPWVTDYAISATTAGNMLAWFGLMSMGGILVAGPLSDLIGNKIPIALSFLLRICLFLLVLKYQNLITFYVFACRSAFGFYHHHSSFRRWILGLYGGTYLR
jgi:sugar phosphate permease